MPINGLSILGFKSNDSDFGLTIRPSDFARQSALSSIGAGNLWQLDASTRGSARFTEAWQSTLAQGISISIVDEGVNYLHADLVNAYDAARDFDPRDNGSSIALPDNATQRHGTQVAGLIAGDAGNNIGTVGAAAGATITSSFLRYGMQFDINELAGIISRQHAFDVSNNSWSFQGAFADNFVLPQFQATANALRDAVTMGRDGLGTSFVFAAGNGKIETANGNIGDDSNFHNLQNSRFVIAVGAHDTHGEVAIFSSPGTNVLLTAPGVGLTTTDGASAGSTMSSYVSGTSFAAPLVSSAVALMMAENPHLGYRDIQEILILSSQARPDSSVENGSGHFNGGGLMFDRKGGFGMLDAGAAVELAKHWTVVSTSANEQSIRASFGANTSMDPTVSVMGIDIDNTSNTNFSVDWVELSLNILDPDLKDLRIELISPDGTRAVIAENFISSGGRTYLNFTFSSAMTWGENPYGHWQLEFTHNTPSQSFSVFDASIKIYGDQVDTNDTYYFTDSFKDLVAQDASRAHLSDGNGGSDTINFAAARSSVQLDLSGQTNSSFQGSRLYLDASFENAFGSCADDLLTGNSAANKIIGGAGADLIRGGGGDDTLLGGDGNDRIDGGAGSDAIDGGNGWDVAAFSGAWNEYAISYDAQQTQFLVSRDAETDTIKNVESFAFGNVTLSAQTLLAYCSAGSPSGALTSGPFYSSGSDEMFSSRLGADRFVFGKNSGSDIVLNFDHSDTIVFQDVPSLRCFADVQSHATQVGLDTIIDLGHGDTVRLANVELSSLTAQDFAFGMFHMPISATVGFGSSAASGGWASQSVYTRLVADVNGDGRADVLGFGAAATYVALGKADGTFQSPIIATNGFGADPTAGGWANQNVYTRQVADVNGDGRADIVGFGAAATYVALGNADGTFRGPIVATTGFGANATSGGWADQNLYTRHLADVNGDGRADIVGFGAAGTYVALATADGTFQSPITATNGFGANASSGGWSDQSVYTRQVADVNGDGRADIVGFGAAATYVALGKADGTFQSPIVATNNFGADASAGGWSNQNVYARQVADVNGDGRADIVGFGGAGAYIAFGQSNGSFGSPIFDLDIFGSENGWGNDHKTPRLLADVNGDGSADVVGFGANGITVALGAEYPIA